MTLPVREIDLNGTYTVSQAAAILQLTNDKTYNLIHTGVLPFIKVGRQYRIGRVRLWAFVNGIEDAASIEEIIRSALRGVDVKQGQCCKPKSQKSE